MVRALASLPLMWPVFKSRRQRHVGWVCCWFSSLLREVFAPGTPVFPSPQKPTLPTSNSIWNARTRFNEFLRSPKCSVVKQITKITIFSVCKPGSCYWGVPWGNKLYGTNSVVTGSLSGGGGVARCIGKVHWQGVLWSMWKWWIHLVYVWKNEKNESRIGRVGV